MNLIKINIKKTNTDERWIKASIEDRGVWICLVAYCTEQNNNGVIEKAGSWGDRAWLHACGLLRSEIQNSPLVKWTKDGLELAMFPNKKESK
jgi:hypothetical protein